MHALVTPPARSLGAVTSWHLVVGYWLAEGMDEYSAERVRLISYGRVRPDAVIG
jgi:hypothetical protein